VSEWTTGTPESWWLASSMVGDRAVPWVAAFGNGGQRLFVLPELAMPALAVGSPA
jgi:hypothetical protein